MKLERVVLTGGSGFIGSVIANRLAEAGIRVVLPTRHAQHANHLLLLPTAEVIETDIRDSASLARVLEGADAVVNLVGVLHSRPGTPYGPDFAHAHIDLPAALVSSCQSVGVPRLIHVSALGADRNGPSEYQRSKAVGEDAVRSAGTNPAWTILQPSVVFGREDSFFNLFAGLVKLFPVLPLAGATTRFQPVCVDDVAKVVMHCLTHPETAGQTYPLAGPTTYTLRELVEYVASVLGKKRLVIPLPEGVAMIQARLMELAPTPLMSRDNVRSMRVDNVTQGEPLPFGFHPTALETVVPSYIGNQTSRASFYPNRTRAHRENG